MSAKWGIGLIVVNVISILALLMVLAMIPSLVNTNTTSAKSLLEGSGYVVLAAGEYSVINTKLDNLKTSADTAVSWRRFHGPSTVK